MLLVLVGLFTSSNVLAAELETELDDGFTRTIYAGAGLGFSVLEPNTNKIEGWDIDERVDHGGQVHLGLDLYKQLSVELHSTNLGSAQLAPAGAIDYHIGAVSALVYAGGNRRRFMRTGLSAYGRGGFGVLTNTPEGDVPFRTVNANLWLWGAGLEYMHANGFGARAELISFAKDAQYGQLGLIYRIGQPRYKRKSQLTILQPKPVTPAVNQFDKMEEEPPPPPPPPPPSPAPSPKVESAVSNSCSSIKGEIDGIRFNTGSAHLTLSARTVLEDVAVTLSRCPELPLIVSAHTDNLGTARTNYILSHRRAWAVINYLRRIGINLLRMTPRAYGETRPIDNNLTVDGRRNNRRVELIANHPETPVSPDL